MKHVDRSRDGENPTKTITRSQGQEKPTPASRVLRSVEFASYSRLLPNAKQLVATVAGLYLTEDLHAKYKQMVPEEDQRLAQKFQEIEARIREDEKRIRTNPYYTDTERQSLLAPFKPIWADLEAQIAAWRKTSKFYRPPYRLPDLRLNCAIHLLVTAILPEEITRGDRHFGIVARLLNRLIPGLQLSARQVRERFYAFQRYLDREEGQPFRHFLDNLLQKAPPALDTHLSETSSL